MTRDEAIKILKGIREEAGAYEEAVCYVGSDEDIEALDMAIEALQREVPKNPIVNYVADSDGARRLNDGWTEDSYLCPVCHAYFGEVYDEGYCYKCGQKLIQKRVRVIKE